MNYPATELLSNSIVRARPGLRPLEDLGLEIFYSLAPGSWGKGDATAAARAVLDHALGPARPAGGTGRRPSSG